MEASKSYAEKYENFQKAINRQEGSYVPNAMTNNGGGLFWDGKTARDVAGDHRAYAKALTSFLDEMWMDVNVLSGLTTTPRISDTFPTAENRLARDGTLTHLQVSPMEAGEYDRLIADPRAFIANVLLPRKFPDLFASRETARESLKVFAEERLDCFVTQMGYTSKYLAETYGVHTCVNMGLILNTPLDHIFDYFRGFRGTLTDLRRQPGKVHAALDAIWEYQHAKRVAAPYDASKGYPFQPCHIPAYLSPKQYREFYWPYEKQLIEWVAASGSKIFLVLEGRWENILDCFLEVPRDSLVLNVDDDDIIKVSKVLGDHQIICGGVKLGDTRLKGFDRMKDDIKRVIDTCAPGGGFICSTDKGFLTPGDINPTLIQCFNFAHEYSGK